MKKVVLEYVNLISSQSNNLSFTLVLGHDSTNKRLPIVIGYYEAQAIAVVMEAAQPARPLTHDLFQSVIETFGITITEVVIHTLKEGIFFAKIICTDQRETFEIDARTSDAVALALRFRCPIFTFDKILDEAGITVEPEEGKKRKSALVSVPIKTTKQSPTSDFTENTLAELNEMLSQALLDEAYERASSLRDEIKKRKARK